MFIIHGAPGLFPSDDNMFTLLGEKYRKPLLSTITHVYTGPSFDQPEEILVQRRSTKSTAQGHGEIQPAAAGFVEFNEPPEATAIREFKEEGKFNTEGNYSFVGKINGNLSLLSNEPIQSLDLTVNNLLGEYNNPCLSYVVFVNPEAKDQIERYRKVHTYNGISPTPEEVKEDGSTEGTVLRLDYQNAKRILSEVWSRDEDFACTFQSFASFMDIFR
jgi:hypothetical protein